MAGRWCSCLLQFRIGIAHGGQIGGARARVEFAEHGIVALLRFQFGDAAIGIIGVAEDDGFRRAGGLASGDDFAVLDRAILFFRFDARVVDALHAIGALLHDAAAAHGDFRIAQELELRSLPILEAHEIEAAHFVRAIVGAIARADAAVVDHVVQAFGAVHRGADGADLLARRIFALHAGNGLEEGFGIGERVIFIGARTVGGGAGVVIAVDADPVHLAAAENLVLADHGDIIFRDAGHHAGVAAVAVVEVDGHAPGVAGILELLVEGKRLGGLLVAFVRETGILLVLL